MDIEEQKKYENQVNKLIDILNDKYPTSYTSRLNHHYDYFKKKVNSDKLSEDIKEYLGGKVLDKPVTFYTFPFDGRVLGNARKSENVIELSLKLFESELVYGSGYKREQKYFDKYISTLENRINWVVIHEYCHLLYPELGHTDKFFSIIEKIYCELIK